MIVIVLKILLLPNNPQPYTKPYVLSNIDRDVHGKWPRTTSKKLPFYQKEILYGILFKC